MQETCICGVDIGGTKIACGLLFTEHGLLVNQGKPERIRTSEALAIDKKRPNAALATAVIELIMRQISALKRSERVLLKGIGVGCCGIIDQPAGILRQANKLPDVRDLPFGPLLRHRLGQIEELNQIYVTIENDANAAGMAEALYGSGRGYREVVYMTISTGIGGVLVSNGQLQRGATGKAGEFGSLYLGSDLDPAEPKRAVWSRLAGGKAIAESVLASVKTGKFQLLRRVAEEHPDKLDVRLLAHCARSGDSDCRILFEKTGSIIGLGIANLIDLYDPDCIVIGGGMVKAFDLWSPAMFASLFSRKPSLRPGMIRTARLGDMVGLIGAAAVCLSELCVSSCANFGEGPGQGAQPSAGFVPGGGGP